ncbi:MAG: hypothetical protein K1X63_13860 [Chitinophagales bacterium]|nr:hypothetical protein [Chitinophagales bacterium]
MKLHSIPNLVYADAEGSIFDDVDLIMSGRSGFDAVALDVDDFSPQPCLASEGCRHGAFKQRRVLFERLGTGEIPSSSCFRSS